MNAFWNKEIHSVNNEKESLSEDILSLNLLNDKVNKQSIRLHSYSVNKPSLNFVPRLKPKENKRIIRPLELQSNIIKENDTLSEDEGKKIMYNSKYHRRSLSVNELKIMKENKSTFHRVAIRTNKTNSFSLSHKRSLIFLQLSKKNKKNEELQFI